MQVTADRRAKVILAAIVFIPTNKSIMFFCQASGFGDEITVINRLVVNRIGSSGIGRKGDSATVFDARSECITIVLDGTPISCSIV